MNYRIIILSLFLTYTTIGVSQCVINELSVTVGECDANGKFYVTINFNHAGTSDRFKLQGNGVNYGLFNNNTLTLKIGPLLADCITNYEFVIRDELNESCVAFKNPGKKCCADQCSIAFDSTHVGNCQDGKYDFYFNLKHNAANIGFDLFNNGQFYGYYKYSQLPLNLENLPSSTTETYNKIVVCANDNVKCCDTLLVLNLCICTIYKVRGQVIECNTESETFSIKIDFKHNLGADSFQIGGNSVNYGKFAYNDLPITINNLPFSPDIDYEFLIVDNEEAVCFASYHLGVVTSCNFECYILNVKATPTECVDGLFYVDIQFEDKNTSLKGFLIRGNGRIYDTFEYGEPYYRVGPLEGNCQTLYEFVVKDLELTECSSFTHFTEPVCCGKLCEMADLVVTEFCENNNLVAFDINFEHNRTSGNFGLKINNQFIGTYPYASLPIKITSINFDLPLVVMTIFDKEDESCRLVKEYEFECYQQPDCNIYDMTVKASACNENQKFYAILKFKITNPTSEKFVIKINGIPFDTLTYGKDVYEIGPLSGDCTTLYKFLIYDLNNSACAEDFSFTEKICCQGACKISDPVVSYTDCMDGRFNLNLNFKYINTLTKFRIKINGVIKGPYLYTQLPVVIENLEQNTAYEVIIWDIDKEVCRLTFSIPALQCTSGTEENLSSGIIMVNDNQSILLRMDEKWLPSAIVVSNLAGSNISVLPAHTENVIDISAFPAGLYFLQIRYEKLVLTRKFIKY